MSSIHTVLCFHDRDGVLPQVDLLAQWSDDARGALLPTTSNNDLAEHGDRASSSDEVGQAFPPRFILDLAWPEVGLVERPQSRRVVLKQLQLGPWSVTVAIVDAAALMAEAEAEAESKHEGVSEADGKEDADADASVAASPEPQCRLPCPSPMQLLDGKFSYSALLPQRPQRQISDQGSESGVAGVGVALRLLSLAQAKPVKATSSGPRKASGASGANAGAKGSSKEVKANKKALKAERKKIAAAVTAATTNREEGAGAGGGGDEGVDLFEDSTEGSIGGSSLTGTEENQGTQAAAAAVRSSDDLLVRKGAEEDEEVEEILNVPALVGLDARLKQSLPLLIPALVQKHGPSNVLTSGQTCFNGDQFYIHFLYHLML